MSRVSPEPQDDRALVSSTFKAVRIERGMSRAEVAAAMNMPIRTYARFESGEIRLNHDYLNRFAVATRSDPQAIHLAVSIGSPDLARRACDNQLGTIFLIELERFNARRGDRIRELDSRTWIAAVTAMFDGLSGVLDATDPAEDWLDKGKDTLRARRPNPGR